MRCEVLVDSRMARRGDRMLRALVKAAPIECRVREKYQGDCDLLMVYGTGHVGRRPAWEAHLASGRHCIGWDLGYWEAAGFPYFYMRATIDADHCWRKLRPENPNRWRSFNKQLRDDYNPKGPIILIGLSTKACAHLKRPKLEWERQIVPQLNRLYPDREIVYKVKKPHEPRYPGLRKIEGPIESCLVGASLVVCHHSNVAVDAAIAGVPVVCWDGAGRALYGSDLANPVMPTLAQRQQFLESLAWWNWSIPEAPEAWTYLLSRLD